MSYSTATISVYTYLGDRLTGEFKGKTCTAVRRPDGKCIRGKNGSMLVEFDGVRAVVLGRRLRKVKAATPQGDSLLDAGEQPAP